MNKAEHKFHRDKKQQIDSNARVNKVPFWKNQHTPIFIPKRKKRK